MLSHAPGFLDYAGTTVLAEEPLHTKGVTSWYSRILFNEPSTLPWNTDVWRYQMLTFVK